MILITGATGTVGRQTVSQLLAAGAAVRALARDPETAGLPGDVEVAGGDLSDPDTLAPALKGVEAVFLVWPFTTAEGAPAVLAAIERETRLLVYLSSAGGQQPDPIGLFHADTERLIEKSKVDWTFLRPSGFASNTLMWAGQIRGEGVVRWPYGAATRSLIHESDIAAVAVRALTGGGHGGAKHVLTGPELLTQADQGAHDRRRHQAPGALGGRPARNRSRRSRRRVRRRNVRRQRARRVGAFRRAAGIGHVDGRTSHRVTGAHVPPVGIRPRRRLSLIERGGRRCAR
jgi:uncharacterized protein YbjT (DUF2867 family)